MPRLLEQVNFPKVVTVFAVTFGVALGVCKLTLFAGSKWCDWHSASNCDAQYLPGVILFGLVELAVMVLSGVGLLISVVVWTVAEALRNRATGAPNTINQSDDSDNTKP